MKPGWRDGLGKGHPVSKRKTSGIVLIICDSPRNDENELGRGCVTVLVGKKFFRRYNPPSAMREKLRTSISIFIGINELPRQGG
ncbi:MAG: hypothetical protein AAGL98_07650 [Planctomycetota bacterium]